MGSDRYKIDPNVIKMAGDSKKQNYGHVLGDLFSNLGKIEKDKKVSTQKIDTVNKDGESVTSFINIDEAGNITDTGHSYKKPVDKNKNLNYKINTAKYESVKDELDDQKVLKNYMASDYGDVNEYLKDNKLNLKTLAAQKQIEQLEDTKMREYWDKELEANEAYLKQKGIFLDDGGNIDLSAVRKQLSNGTHNLELSQAFERKYNTKLYKPKTKGSLTFDQQIKADKIIEEKTTDAKLETDLVKVRENYKKLFGEDMSTAQEEIYKEKGELPYLVYGTKNLSNQRKKLIDANIEIEKALSKLDEYSYKEIDSVVGFFQGRGAVIAAKDATEQLEPRQKEILTILGHINSDKMHELYGAALTGGETQRAKTWNLDTGQSTETLLTAVNELRAKNTIQFENNTHGVYGVPMDGMSFGQYDISKGEEQKENADKMMDPSKMSREDKIKFLQG
jgi:hypothetical protein